VDYITPLDTLESVFKAWLEDHAKLVSKVPVRSMSQRFSSPVYLEEDVCPEGTAPCEGEECPPQGLNMFTASGEECFSKADVEKARRARLTDLTARAKKQQPTQVDTRRFLVAARDLTSVVSAAATLSSRLQNVGHAKVECNQVNTLSSDPDSKRAFCGTLLTDSGARKCAFNNDTCAPAV
jgi:hypothetical protein